LKIGAKKLKICWWEGMGSFLETDKIRLFNYIKSLNNKHGDGLPGQGVPGHDEGFEGKDGGLPPSSPCDFFLGVT
jgi:hypothetical protein